MKVAINPSNEPVYVVLPALQDTPTHFDRARGEGRVLAALALISVLCAAARERHRQGAPHCEVLAFGDDSNESTAAAPS